MMKWKISAEMEPNKKQLKSNAHTKNFWLAKAVHTVGRNVKIETNGVYAKNRTHWKLIQHKHTNTREILAHIVRMNSSQEMLRASEANKRMFIVLIIYTFIHLIEFPPVSNAPKTFKTIGNGSTESESAGLCVCDLCLYGIKWLSSCFRLNSFRIPE